MSKRYSSVFHDKFVQKKARFDVKIDTNVRISTNRQSSHSAGPSRIPSTPPFPNQLPRASNDLWGEDEDDEEFVLLASQVADILEKSQKQQQQKLQNTQAEFERFRQEVKSSTQKAPDTNGSCFDEADDLFKDFIDQEEQSEALNARRGELKTREGEEEYKVPPKRDNPGDQMEVAPIDICSDIQVNYLRDQLKKLKKENERLKEENSVTFEKYQIKDGEATTLRYELEQQQSKNNPAILNANADAENARQSLMIKVKEQEKLIKALEVENTMRNAVERSFYTQQVQTAKDEYYDLNLPSFDDLRHYFADDVKLDVFRVKTGVKGTDVDKKLTKYVIEMQNIVAQVLGWEDNDGTGAVCRELQSLALKGMFHIKKYSLKLEFISYTDSKYIPSMEYLHLSKAYTIEKHLNKKLDLFQLDKLYPTEASIVGRRFLANLAFVCKKLPLIDYLLEEMDMLLNDDMDSSSTESFSNMLIKTINDIGYSSNYLRYIVFIHASSVLLDSLAYQLIDTGKHITFATELFKSIVMMRPHMNTLVVLSKFLHTISEMPIAAKFLPMLCHSSPKSSFLLNETYKIHQYSEETCILQIYCTLLESTCLEVDQSRKLSQWYVDTVMELTMNTVAFFLVCFGKHTQWMRNFPEGCDCYNKAGSCVVILIHFILNCWLKSGMGQCRMTSALVQEGVLLLHMIFGCNYRESVLRSGGQLVKNRLQKIYNLTKNYYRFFDFGPSHKCAIESLDLKLIIMDPLGSSSPRDPTDEHLTALIGDFFKMS